MIFKGPRSATGKESYQEIFDILVPTYEFWVVVLESVWIWFESLFHYPSGCVTLGKLFIFPIFSSEIC